MSGADLENLSKQELIKIVRMLAKNWLTVDGLWFRGVEEKFGLDAAVELDVKMWWRQAEIEARRIKETLDIRETGIPGVLKTLEYMSWSLAYYFDYEKVTPTSAVLVCTHCLPQESRVRQGIGEFPCKPTGEAVFTRIIEAIDPGLKYRCIACPPDEHPAEFWCKWEVFLPPPTTPPEASSQ
ncbi:MAG: hypothetical protein HY673_12275 [Chloroflexi bacterium]|nr:hypothetical protein [Chloroflexota bacterium]